ncbi:MAG: hypothetical protein OXF41_10580 [bacterium]|nr:hypothetical protein [bacterium]
METLLEYAPLATVAMVALLGIGLWVDRSESREMRAEWKGHVDKDREAFRTFIETTQEIRRERAKWERSVDVDRSNSKTFMKTFQRQLETFQRQLETLQQQLQEVRALVAGRQRPWLGRSSPLRLTEEGQNLSGQLGAGAWAGAAAEELTAKAKGLEPFEIEEMAFGYAGGFELPRSMRRIGYNEDVPLAVIRQVLGVVLRDELIHRSEVT